MLKAIGNLIGIIIVVVVVGTGGYFAVKHIDSAIKGDAVKNEAKVIEEFEVSEEVTYYVTDKYQNKFMAFIGGKNTNNLTGVENDHIYTLKVPINVYNRTVPGDELKVGLDDTGKLGISEDGETLIYISEVEEE